MYYTRTQGLNVHRRFTGLHDDQLDPLAACRGESGAGGAECDSL
jgi:hypothetical protein